MKPNPGGQLDPDDIVGRDELIDELWEILEGRNIYMNDLRRIGKTMILNKMAAHPPAGWLVLKRDLGGLRTGAEFASQVYRDAHALLSKKKRALRRMEQLVGGIDEVAGVIKLKDGSAAPWKETLTRTIADLHEEHQTLNERVVFFWDEVPFLLDNIRVAEGAERAMEVLDTLRSLSQDYPSIRFLFTGSIGIHHVLSQLRKEGYNNSPLNTFERVAPGPLNHPEAVDLARELILGAKLKTDDPDLAAESIASLTGDVPFYIHRLIARIPKSQGATPDSLDACLVNELIDANSDWDLAHYRNRIPKYYPEGNDEAVVLALLDSLAVSQAPRPFRELANEAKSIVAGADDEQIRGLLKLLLADHYLTRDANGGYVFRLEIVRRWWAIDRDLLNPQVS
ncbi:hypothetical protein [Cerasicoccus frondis]|uniref:hypothetical protein n=1 Tax=Cerasicoccus frondis TaxID=490090 RepID=UPI002852AB8E|nr:hypothetical protein [Cerasicoccus frondis]